MSARPSARRRRALLLGAALVATAAAADAATTPRYRVTGVRDAAGVATVVYCTNLGPAAATVTVAIRDFDGGVDCTLSYPGLAAFQSATFASRQTLLYEEDRVCASAPQTNGGSALVSANTTGFADLICTAQVLGSAAATPRFATGLTLFSPLGDLIRDLIFADGFENGTTNRW